MTQHINRTQLQGLGLTAYQAELVTQGLAPLQEPGELHHRFEIADVLARIAQLLSSSRLHYQTQSAIEAVVPQLIQLAPVAPILDLDLPETECSDLARQLMAALYETDQSMSELLAQAASIQGKYGSN